MCRELHLGIFLYARESGITPCLSSTCKYSPRWRSSCNSQDASSCEVPERAQVTTLFGTPEVQPRSKHTLLPILTVLFLISYGLMTLLIVEQGSTIQSQRTLIQQLIGDSTELSALKGKAVQQQQTEQAQAVAPPVQAQQNRTAETPSTQAAPSEKPRAAQNKAHRPMPEKPPVPASDIADARRTLMSI